jgi:hypothetical protein
MRGNALPYPNAQESVASAKARLGLLLLNATDQRLASFTADSLAATHRVRFADVAAMLERERGRRGSL